MQPHPDDRRGTVLVLTALLLVAMASLMALAIDYGTLLTAYNQQQAAADAAALAAAADLLDPDRLKGTPYLADEIAKARQTAVTYAGYHRVLGTTAAVDPNSSNGVDGDVVVGYLNNPQDYHEPLSFTNLDQFNTVQVRVRRTAANHGPVGLFFANVLGVREAEVGATAAATFKDGVVGFKVTPNSGNAGLLPFTLQRDSWTHYITNGNGSDHWKYDEATDTITAGHDGIPEVTLYPESGSHGGRRSLTSSMPPGNFGTVDVGNPNNSTADITRQILDGVNASDLSYHGGQLTLGADGTVILNGDTGISAGFKDELDFIKGNPRTIPLYSTVSGPGNNAMFTIVKFAGIRILDVKLTGSPKYVTVQPAFVIDSTVVTQPGNTSSYFVYAPVYLSR